jgi:hypothetical protein
MNIAVAVKIKTIYGVTDNENGVSFIADPEQTT